MQESLEKIDTSYWKTKDKDWMEARKADWPHIEQMYCHRKTKKAMAVIKQYYLKGKMPKWGDFKYWDDCYRHLDLFCLLWLHPSSDQSVLEPLCKDYMRSDVIHHEDVLVGYGEFLDSHLILVSSPFPSMEDYGFPYTGTKALTLFKVLYKNIEFIKEQITRLLGSTERFEHEGKQVVYGSGFSYLCLMSEWLMIEKMLPLHEECIYQYDEVLDWCYLSFSKDKNYFEENNDKEVIDQYHTALYRIHHFDTEKEGDTCRTRFVHKIRKIFDERDFIPEFKQMWEGVKAGKVEVKDPWKR